MKMLRGIRAPVWQSVRGKDSSFLVGALAPKQLRKGFFLYAVNRLVNKIWQVVMGMRQKPAFARI
jgi:hypothetical protein